MLESLLGPLFLSRRYALELIIDLSLLRIASQDQLRNRFDLRSAPNRILGCIPGLISARITAGSSLFYNASLFGDDVTIHALWMQYTLNNSINAVWAHDRIITCVNLTKLLLMGSLLLLQTVVQLYSRGYRLSDGLHCMMAAARE